MMLNPLCWFEFKPQLHHIPAWGSWESYFLSLSVSSSVKGLLKGNQSSKKCPRAPRVTPGGLWDSEHDSGTVRRTQGSYSQSLTSAPATLTGTLTTRLLIVTNTATTHGPWVLAAWGWPLNTGRITRLLILPWGQWELRSEIKSGTEQKGGKAGRCSLPSPRGNCK